MLHHKDPKSTLPTEQAQPESLSRMPGHILTGAGHMSIVPNPKARLFRSNLPTGAWGVPGADNLLVAVDEHVSPLGLNLHYVHFEVGDDKGGDRWVIALSGACQVRITDINSLTSYPASSSAPIAHLERVGADNEYRVAIRDSGPITP